MTSKQARCLIAADKDAAWDAAKWAEHNAKFHQSLAELIASNERTLAILKDMEARDV